MRVLFRLEAGIGGDLVRGVQTCALLVSLSEALGAMRSVDSSFGQAEAVGYLGELAERMGDEAAAEACYTRVAELLTGLGAPREAWLIHRIRALTLLCRQVLGRDPPG